MTKQTRFIVHGGLLAALYVVLTYAQNFLWPDSTSMAIQMRMSEALCIFGFFTPAAIPGLTIGCLLFNISNAGALPLDWIMGTGATLGAVGCMWLLRNVKFLRCPWPGLLMPAVWNAVLVGWELTIYIGDTFLLNALFVFIGEAVVLLVPGAIVYCALTARRLDRRFFPDYCR